MSFIGDTFTGATAAAFHLAAPANSEPDKLDMDATSTFSGNRYFVDNTVPAGDIVTDHFVHETLHRQDQRLARSAGYLNTFWNAWVCHLPTPLQLRRVVQFVETAGSVSPSSAWETRARRAPGP